MKTRTEDEMLNLIVGFAEADERIRVTVMNGSRANPHPEDLVAKVTAFIARVHQRRPACATCHDAWLGGGKQSGL